MLIPLARYVYVCMLYVLVYIETSIHQKAHTPHEIGNAFRAFK